MWTTFNNYFTVTFSDELQKIFRPTYLCARALTYLHSWLCAYKTVSISETAEDRAEVTINRLYKIVHWLSIAAKMYDPKWPLRRFKVVDEI